MADKPLILYHYPLSPFSEKMRAMLGYAGIPWRSVQVREMPPRPLLQRLAGGYRKVPVAQIGADVFCDTRCIATEIARRARRPRLALERCSPAEQAFVARTDLEVFLACTLSANTLAMGQRVLQSMSWPDLARFAWDRAQMGWKAAGAGGAPLSRRPRQLVREHLADLAQRLERQPFLFGRQPSHADFSAFHGLWFLHVLARSPLIKEQPRVLEWLERMRSFGHGSGEPMGEDEALEWAASQRPRRLEVGSGSAPQVGMLSAIEPLDYAQDRSTGVLAAVTANRWVLARDTEGLGRLHVHFPRQGYRLLQGEEMGRG